MSPWKFFCDKPVITHIDLAVPWSSVVDCSNGYITEPDPIELASGDIEVADDPECARQMGGPVAKLCRR